MIDVSSFWDGELSHLEILCMESFLQNGANYTLYVYDPPAHLPAGVILKDAASIVPREQIFRYAAGEFNLGSIAGFTNLFRFTAIHRLGGWWIDTDVCCLQPFDVESEELFVREASQSEQFYVGTAIFKSARGSPVLENALRRLRQKDLARVVHGETGPRLLTDVIVELGKQHLVVPQERYLPVPWWDFRRLFYDETLSLNGASTVHFWNAMLSAEQFDKNATFAPASVFERLRRQYGLA